MIRILVESMAFFLVLGYIDPGSGALIWQSLLAAGAGVVFYFRRWLLRIHDRIFPAHRTTERKQP